jgi:hypothetical protein
LQKEILKSLIFSSTDSRVWISSRAHRISPTSASSQWRRLFVCQTPFCGDLADSLILLPGLEFPHREVARILQCQEKTLAPRIGRRLIPMVSGNATRVKPPKMPLSVSRIGGRVFRDRCSGRDSASRGTQRRAPGSLRQSTRDAGDRVERPEAAPAVAKAQRLEDRA